ncbi:hypothetical protein XM38_046470 [Halomicronema hongdechloris C2206]|uniref:Uncharacterized protein n=1 Tax=Halomicronema hongdechloris C2206 TaxID=1641165 RepID=A0A1Z3HTR4_9CYAN|nr:hypothetical protein XM38_008540 [Halomicronema hongdechloris C2206]ASC73675.1 hypothetical protein XM38_046470 [Halomicronema hongdechloris C2206]
MDEQYLNQPEGIPLEDWERTPVSVKQLVGQLSQRLVQLEHQYQDMQAQMQLLQEQLNRNSTNSSQPPSSDPPQVEPRRRRRNRGRGRGGHPGHPGHHRRLFAPEACETISDHYPETCANCGAALSGEDPNPYRHQTVEMPPVVPQVKEYRLHQRVCPQCGHRTRAKLPTGVSSHVYGPRVVATVGVLSSLYRPHSAWCNRPWPIYSASQ